MGNGTFGLRVGAAIAWIAVAGCTTTPSPSGGTASSSFHWPWSQTKPASAMPVASSGPGSTSDPTSLASKGPKPGPDLNIATARMYEQAGKGDLAREQYERALKANPTYLPALLGFAQFRDRQHEFAEADKLYERALKKYPEEAAIYNDMALSRQHRGQLEDAARLMTKAIELQPDKKLYRNNMASIFVDSSRPDEALKQLVSAHGPAVGRYNLAILLHRKGADEAARYQFAQAAEIDPSIVAAREWAHRLAPHYAATQIARSENPQPVMPTGNYQGELPQPITVNPGYAQAELGQSAPRAAGENFAGPSQDVAREYGVRYPQHAAASEDDAGAVAGPVRRWRGRGRRNAPSTAAPMRLPPRARDELRGRSRWLPAFRRASRSTGS